MSEKSRTVTTEARALRTRRVRAQSAPGECSSSQRCPQTTPPAVHSGHHHRLYSTSTYRSNTGDS
jgi:hypothetical protein